MISSSADVHWYLFTTENLGWFPKSQGLTYPEAVSQQDLSGASIRKKLWLQKLVPADPDASITASAVTSTPCVTLQWEVQNPKGIKELPTEVNKINGPKYKAQLGPNQYDLVIFNIQAKTCRLHHLWAYLKLMAYPFL